MQLEQKILELSTNLNPEVVKMIASEIKSVNHLVLTLFSLCATGFFTLCVWMFFLTNNILKKVSEINNDLRGTVNEKGLATRVYSNQEDIVRIKKVLKINGQQIDNK